MPLRNNYEMPASTEIPTASVEVRVDLQAANPELASWQEGHARAIARAAEIAAAASRERIPTTFEQIGWRGVQLTNHRRDAATQADYDLVQ